MGFIFEKLEVYQRAVDFAERIETLSKGMAGQGYYHFARPIAQSVSFHFTEHRRGNGRWHPRDRKNFFWIARGSVFECVPLVELCRRQKLIPDEICTELKAELEALAKMLTGLVKGSDRRGQRESPLPG